MSVGKLWDECPLCELRADLHDGTFGARHGSWHLRREHDSMATLHVTIESKQLGIAMADEMVVFYCPLCGKRLER